MIFFRTNNAYGQGDNMYVIIMYTRYTVKGRIYVSKNKIKSYTNRLEDAQIYKTWNEADLDKCGNEIVISVKEILFETK